jgi:SAM-dependent methyltransferase
VIGYDPATLHFYAAEAPVYTASGKWGVARHLPTFLDRLPTGARVLELGCGGGIDAEYMVGRGFAVDATDGTAEIAAKAEARLQQTVRVMRFDQLDAIAAYDAVVASASLLHVPRGALPEILALIYRALKPDGWHVASYKAGGAEGRDRFGRYFNFMEADELHAAYSVAGRWRSIDIQSGTGGGYDGVQRPWNIVAAQK